MPDFKKERKILKEGFDFVVGVDEAGRGSLAGPVVASAVIIDINNLRKISRLGPNDSKKLSAKRREDIYNIITRGNLVRWGVGIVSEKTIDRINIARATEKAMEKAVNNLIKKNSLATEKGFLILDGIIKISLSLPQISVIKADEKIISCSVASILAKVSRDRLMIANDRKHPCYGFKKHKGYGTAYHLKMLKEYGPCLLHRKSYRPIAKVDVI